MMRRSLVLAASVLSAVVVAGGCASSSEPSPISLTFVPAAGSQKPAAPVDPTTIPCPLMPADEAFVQELLSRWRTTLSEELKLPPRPLPWTVLLANDCVYHLSPREDLEGGKHLTTGLMWNGRPLIVYAKGYVGEVTLPNGEKLARGAHSFTRRMGDDDVVVLSLLELWKGHAEIQAQPNPADAVLARALQALSRTTTAGPPPEGNDPAQPQAAR